MRPADRVCKHAGDDVRHAKRPAPHPGPRCTTCHREHTKATKARNAERRVVKLYGLSPGEAAELLAFQNGRCAVLGCRATGKTKALAVDHDHTTGAVRGRMCGPHNRWIGMAGDRPEVFESIADYLRNPPYERMKRMSTDPLADDHRAAELPDPLDYPEPGPPVESPVKHDRWDRYILPVPPDYPADLAHSSEAPWTRASTVKAAVQNKDRISKWNLDMLTAGMAISPDLVAYAASVQIGKPGAGKIMGEIREQAWTRAGKHAASNYGSAHHAFTEQIDAATSQAEVNRVMDRVPELLRKDIEAYIAALSEHNLVPQPQYIERVVLNTDLGGDGSETSTHHAAAAAGVPGRIDRAYRLDSMLVIGDLKTGKNAVEYGAGETAVQLGIYSNASWILDEDTMTWHPMPDVSTKVGYLIHLPIGQGRCEIVPLDLVYGYEGARIAQRVRRWQRDSAKRAVLSAVAVPVLNDHQIGDSVDVGGTEFTKVSDEPFPPTEGDRPMGELGDVAEQVSAQPPAEKKSGQRACSVCGQRGHRKGSVKCAGPLPGETEQHEYPDDQNAIDHANGDDVPYCQQHPGAGWSSNVQWGSVCAECDKPSEAVYRAKTAENEAKQQIASSRERIDRENREIATDDVDPFADIEPNWSQEIRNAATLDALKDVGRLINAAGAMTPELRDQALARRAQL